MLRCAPAGALSGDALEAVRRQLKTEFPGQDFKVSAENNGVYLRGTAKDLTSAGRAVQIASGAGKVVNLLNVEVPSADPQILLKVRFASVDRNKAKDLGINLFSLGFGNVIGGITTGQFSPPSISGGSGSGGGSSVSDTRRPSNVFERAEYLRFSARAGCGRNDKGS